MSGHGSVERRLLVILANGSRRFNTFELAGKVFEVPHNRASESQMVSTRRALRHLRRERLVCSSLNRFVDRRQDWWLAVHDANAAFRSLARLKNEAVQERAGEARSAIGAENTR